ncbi:MAG: phosphate signaling complex protein PhoU [Planctomycetota bacterium]
MTKHFFDALELLKRDLLTMGGLVETAVLQATRGFLTPDDADVDRIIDGDAEVNALELRIEEECLHLLALYGPNARDLRFVVAVFKITNDLERIADLAVNIAERIRPAIQEGQGMITAEVQEMSDRVRRMVRQALDAFVALDAGSAQEVLEMDDRVDDLLRDIYEQQSDAVGKGLIEFKPAVRTLSFAKSLERIADHTTNVAEDVIYLATGDVIKHQY